MSFLGVKYIPVSTTGMPISMYIGKQTALDSERYNVEAVVCFTDGIKHSTALGKLRACGT